MYVCISIDQLGILYKHIFMKSRITIDVDYSNQPVIKIEWVQSEDVRDKLVKRFLEAFGSESILARFYYTNSLDSSNSRAEISPIGPFEYKEHYEIIPRIENPDIKIPPDNTNV